MNVKYIDGILSEKMVSDIADFLSLSGPKHLYLALDGGGIGFALTIIDMINKAEDLTVFGTNRLYSAGLYIYTEIKCKKHLVEGTRGMWHQGFYNAEINNDGKPTYTCDVFNLRIHKENYKKVIMALAKKLSMKKKEIKKIKKGKDVYFTYKRMKEMFYGF